MPITKNHYYIYLENSKILDLSLIKKRGKFTVIYRANKKKEDIDKIIKFRKECKKRGVGFFVANDLIVAVKCKADGLYLSSYNKVFYDSKKLKLIGSAHNYKEINEKVRQGCRLIFLSRLFKTDYAKKKDFYDVVRFNLLILEKRNIISALGGIRLKNLNKLNIVIANSFAVLSEIKKKPAKIISRLF